MKPKSVFFLSLLFFFAFGCVVPGVAQPAAPPAPTATIDSLLPTLVAEKVFSALTETAQAVPPTPAATATFTPEPPTATPSVTPTPPIASSLQAQENGGTLFVDERAGYSVFFPAGWLLVRPNQPELEAALAAQQSANPTLYEALQRLQASDQNIVRLYAADTQAAPVPGEPLTTVVFILDETRGISFNSDQDLQAIAGELEKSIPGLEVTALDILIPPGGISLGALESKTPYQSSVLYEKRVYFMGKTGLVYALLTCGESAKESAFPAFDALMDTVRLR